MVFGIAAVCCDVHFNWVYVYYVNIFYRQCHSFTSHITTPKKTPNNYLKRSSPRYTVKNREKPWTPDGNGFGSMRVEKPDPQDFLRSGEGLDKFSHPSSEHYSNPGIDYSEVSSNTDPSVEQIYGDDTDKEKFYYNNKGGKRRTNGKRRTHRKRHIKRSNRRRRR